MFYTFRQNNTGGDFIIDEATGISVQVIVEADSVSEANYRAERIGVYFNGCSDGRDCTCCGDRWYDLSETYDKGDEVPTFYGTPLVDAVVEYGSYAGDQVDTFVHLKDGRFFGFHVVGDRYVYRGDMEDLMEVIPGEHNIERPVIEAKQASARLDDYRAKTPPGTSYALADDVPWEEDPALARIEERSSFFRDTAGES